MLVLTRQDLAKDMKTDTSKSRVKLFHRGEYIGTVGVNYAGFGTARLGFDCVPDLKIVREEADAQCCGK